MGRRCRRWCKGCPSGTRKPAARGMLRWPCLDGCQEKSVAASWSGKSRTDLQGGSESMPDSTDDGRSGFGLERLCACLCGIARFAGLFVPQKIQVKSNLPSNPKHMHARAKLLHGYSECVYDFSSSREVHSGVMSSDDEPHRRPFHGFRKGCLHPFTGLSFS